LVIKETREEREQHFRSLERQVKTYLLLGNETINMLHYLSTDIVDPFMRYGDHTLKPSCLCVVVA
jgi:hypothetical protein